MFENLSPRNQERAKHLRNLTIGAFAVSIGLGVMS